jgi:dCMP deaminase
VFDHEERYADRETKYLFVVHCDTNAIYSAASRGVSLFGTTMYLTGPPCNECMKGIVQVGIRRVVFPRDNPFESDPEVRDRWAKSMRATQDMAMEADVEFIRV